MTLIAILKWIHIIGAAVLLGTGAGIAFFMFMANRTKNAALVAHTASIVVIADVVFTTTAVIIQPITGTILAYLIGWSLGEGWILLSILLYVLAARCLDSTQDAQSRPRCADDEHRVTDDILQTLQPLVYLGLSGVCVGLGDFLADGCEASIPTILVAI